MFLVSILLLAVSGVAGLTPSARMIVVPRPPIYAGQTVHLTCSTSGSRQPVVTSWSKDGMTLLSHGHVKVEPHLLAVTVSNAGEDDEGRYTCITNTVINGLALNASIVLNIKDRPSIAYLGSKNLSVAIEGSNATLNCTGNNFTVVSWRHNGTTLSSHKSRMFYYPVLGSELFVYDVKQSDAGLYVCKGIPKKGKSAEASITLKVYTEPKVSVHPASLTIYSGQKADFVCTASGVPAPVVTWWIDGRQPSVVAVGDVLGIDDTRTPGTFNYSCSASNDAGKSSAGVTLKINGTTTVVEVNITGNKPGTVQPRTVSLPCISASNLEHASFFWWKNGFMIVSGTSGVTEVRTSSSVSLSIARATYDDAGSYKCTAVKGSYTHTTRLIISGPPGIPSRASVSVTCLRGVNITWSRPEFDGNSPIGGYQVTIVVYGPTEGDIKVRDTRVSASSQHLYIAEPSTCSNCSLLGIEVQVFNNYGFSRKLLVTSLRNTEQQTAGRYRRDYERCPVDVRPTSVIQRHPGVQILLVNEDCTCDTDHIIKELSLPVTKNTIATGLFGNFRQLPKGINSSNSEITADQTKTRLLYRLSLDGSLLEALHTVEQLQRILNQSKSVTINSCSFRVDRESACSFIYFGDHVTPCQFSEERSCQESMETKESLHLTLGLRVGVGVGILLVIVVVIFATVTCKRRRKYFGSYSIRNASV